MRTIVSIIFFISIAGLVMAQQDSSGVYMSAQDFQIKKLEYAINCKTQKHKIKRKSFFRNPDIVVIHNDSVYALSKNEIYGYRDCDGKEYRFVDQNVYQIINGFEQIVLYKYFIYTKDPRTKYFFSKGNSGVVDTLTVDNLKNAFPDNRKFHQLLDLTIEKDSELVKLNKNKKEFNVLSIYKMSLE